METTADPNLAPASSPSKPAAKEGERPSKAAAPAAQKKRSPLFFAIVGAVVIGGAIAGATYYLRSRHYENTDDAQIDANITNVSPRVTGTVLAVYVAENQFVKAGDALAELDTRDLDIAVAEAKATVAQAQAQLEAEDPTIAMTETSNTTAVASAESDLTSAQATVAAASKDVNQLEGQIAQAEASDKQAESEKERAEKLLAQGAIAQAEYDARSNAAAGTAAAVASLKSALAAARDRVAEASAKINSTKSKLSEVKTNAPMQVTTRQATVAYRKANLDLAKAQLAQAELNVTYAKILAPVAGVIGKKALNIGDRVQPGQQVFAITQLDSIWVNANFRETQLADIQPGQPTTIHVDAIDVDLRGSVESIGGATGARLSLLPPENATGNYVKVVQRVPVRIKLDPGQPGLDRLRPGMSVEPEILVR